MAERQVFEQAAWEGELFRLLVDNVVDYAIFVLDTEGRVTRWSHGSERLLGYTEAEVVGTSADRFFTPEDVQDGVPGREMRAALATGRGMDDRWHVRKDGSRFWANGVMTPLWDEAGAHRGFAKIMRDRTELKRREEALAERERLASYGRSIGEALNDRTSLVGMLVRCSEVTVEHLDGAFARVWTVDDANETLELRASAGMYTHTDGPHARVPIGRFKIGMIARERKPHLTNAVVGDPSVPAQDWAVNEGMVAFAGYPLVVDDRLVGVMAMFARHPLSEATLEAMASVADGIALGIERKRGEERLRQEREWLRVTLASIGDAVIATDLDGRVTFLNPVAEGLTGWPQREAAGAPLESVFRIVNEQTRGGVESPAIRALREGAVVGLANHTVLIARDGGERSIDDSAAPIRDEAGSVKGAVLIFRDVTEKRGQERALEASEALKAAVLRTALDAIITIDHEGRVVDWNPAAEAIFGHDRGAVLGREIADLIVPPSLRAAHRRGIAHYLATGDGPVLGRRIEIVAVRADGAEFPVELAVTPITSDGPPLFTAHVRDISERRRVESRREARLAVTHVLAAAPTIGTAAPGILKALCEGIGWDLGALWTADEGAGVLRCVEVWSRRPAAVEAFLTATREGAFARGVGLPGQVWECGRAVWIPDVAVAPEFPRASIADAVGLHGAFAAPVVLGDRFLGVVEFFSGEVREPDPDLLEMMATLGGQVGLFIERRRADERLRRSERELADFFENATVGLHWVGPDGTILRANRAEFDLLGYERGEYVGRHIAEFHADEAVILDILRRLKVGEDLKDYPARLRCKDGSIKDVLIDSSVLQEGGEFVHTRCFTRDVTERRRAEEELREQTRIAETANNAKDQFLAVLSHELRTPLNPILLAVSSMLDRPTPPEEIQPTLTMIRQNVNLQARLIDDLLDVMRIVQGKMPLHWGVADCHALIEQAVQICRSDALGRDQHLVLDLAADQRHVNADSARLQQVLWNLLKNAIKFTPEGGTITVRTRNEGGRDTRIVIEVSDTGIGIEPETLPNIFDPFQQGETTITRKFGGLGLGLAICKGIVDGHDGALTAASGGKDRGTTFRVVLKTMPVPKQGLDGDNPNGEEAATPSLNRLNILVVEDEPTTLRLMARLLNRLGHQVKTAGRVSEAWETFRDGDIDLIISDIGLPDGSGLDLLRKVKSVRPVPAIALTGYGMDDDIRRSRDAGFTTHMTKPIDFSKLEAMIRQIAS